MFSLLVALVLVGGSGQKTPSILGEWSVWRITEGDILVSPPKQLKGKLVLRANRTFTSHTEESGYVYDSRGTYRIHGNWVDFKGTSVSVDHGQKGSRHSMGLSLFCRNGRLWDGNYVMGGGSCVYCRPGKGSSIPRSEKDWPSMEDIWSR